MKQAQVHNLTRDQSLGTGILVADNMLTRMRGLIGSKPLERGEGLLIVPCSSIHTHFMSFPIDVLHVNKSQQVVAIDDSIAPWRFGRLRRGVRFVVELPAGTARATGTQVGDQLQVHGYKL